MPSFAARLPPSTEVRGGHGAPQVSLASFAFLFSEFVQYSQSRVSNIGELERRRAPAPPRLTCAWLPAASEPRCLDVPPPMNCFRASSLTLITWPCCTSVQRARRLGKWMGWWFHPSSTCIYISQACLSHAGVDGAACRLEDGGYGVGFRLLEALSATERGRRRDTRLLDALRFVHGTLWKYLFGRPARDLEQSNTVSTHAASDMRQLLVDLKHIPQPCTSKNCGRLLILCVNRALRGP